MIYEKARRGVACACAFLRLVKLTFVRGRDEKKPLRILAAHEFTSSGASMLLGHLCMEYAQRGDTVVIVTENMDMVSSALLPCLTHAACLLRIPSTHSRIYFKLLKKMGAREILLNTVVTGGFAGPAKEAMLRTVSLIHELTASLEILKAKPLVDQILRYADAIIFPARAVQDAFCIFAGAEQDERKMHILPQGYYKGIQEMPPRDECREWIRRQLCLEACTMILLGAGVINFGKGIDMILPALRRLNKEDGDYHLVWLGAGGENDAFFIWLRVQINAMGLSGRVHFIGFIDDSKTYMRWLRGADAFILSSREDAFPSVVIEAGIAQLPVVAFEAGGGGADMVRRDGLGICVPMGDEMALCEAVRTVCGARDGARDCPRPRKTSGQYSFSDYASRLLSY